METRTYTVYKFDELTEEGKSKALDNLRYFNVDFDWWDFIYADAEQIGLKITSFDLDRNKHCKGRFLLSMPDMMSKIMKDHGKETQTYFIASDYKEQIQGLDPESTEYNDIEEKFHYEILEEYADILQKEFDYQTRDEAIIETIQANDYDFTEDGKID